MTAAVLVFWISVLLLLHSYVFYPALLALLTAGKKEQDVYAPLADGELPPVVVMFSVYNGQRVIRQKIESIFSSVYPAQKLFAWVGSDHSDDDTNAILQELAAKYPNLKLFLFNERKGKIKVMNELLAGLGKAGFADDAILVPTDVSAIFRPDCISRLVQHFQRADIGLVSGHLLKGVPRSDGISFQEKTYYERELRMKQREGQLWGAVMGAFGACYAIRKADFRPVPSNFLVDDFYVTMQVLRSGKKAVHDARAAVYMDIPNESAEEFRRKVRISAGNFQNLLVFWPMLFRFSGLAFAFWSHKLIRWFGPFLIVACYAATCFIYDLHPIYRLAFWGQTLLLLTPLINYLLERLKVHLKLLKFVAHFYLMNLGILAGFIRFMKGIKNNVWTPTQR